MWHALDLLLIEPIRLAMLFVLGQAYLLTGSYGLSLLLLSLAFNLALLPVYHLAERVQDKERAVQQQMAHKIEEFKFAFKGQERYWMLRTLYRQHGYHPVYALRALLPLAIQIPFFIATFGLLSHFAPLQGASFFWLSNLSRPDHLLAGINLLPLLMTALNILAAWLYGRHLATQEWAQSIVVALVFLYFLYDSASGLVLYWTANNLISVLKSLAYASTRQDIVPEGKKCS